MTHDSASIPAPPAPAPFRLAGRSFNSRLLLGTGKYKDAATMTAALEASGTEIVTVALRRVNLDELGRLPTGSLIDQIDPKRYLLLPNT
nr:thiazole synthase [Thermoanaerobaculia bacterium]